MPAWRDPEERFHEKYTISEHGCWIWRAACQSDGYGSFKEGAPSQRTVLAHRWAYEYFVGSIPEHLEIDHLCRNRACVNPKHLEPVPHIINTTRGEGHLVAAKTHGVKTHCPRGHPYSGYNLIIRKEGNRQCRTCHQIRDRARRPRKNT